MPFWPLPGNKNLLLWHLTESEDAWIDLAEKSDHLFPNKLPNRRDIERFATLLLLKEAKLEDQLLYNEFGKPVLRDGRSISISHDKNLVGIIIHEEEIGLDIQTVEERIHRIANKFCNEDELNQFQSTEERTAIWCTKEAIFKYFGTDVPFAESITVTAINWNSEEILANYSGVHGSRIFTLKLMNLNNTFVVYTL
ncbi:MAG: 4'-phosphopantetheinyl transferase superfamily protein [Flavobacteriales bacterium]|nr:4'-phosphopantetheinyl transferase superfamily protein [Flavobacteriales bacterium]MDP4731691.1 4'-phosphopantetheinyl transferase superfamily protein [Flavobacteriales bacterium]MDP4951569.1 4'-phosphopantetheinyl transferase superfamily protein [Flavobacteriales bacterium]